MLRPSFAMMWFISTFYFCLWRCISVCASHLDLIGYGLSGPRPAPCCPCSGCHRMPEHFLFPSFPPTCFSTQVLLAHRRPGFFLSHLGTASSYFQFSFFFFFFNSFFTNSVPIVFLFSLIREKPTQPSFDVGCCWQLPDVRCAICPLGWWTSHLKTHVLFQFSFFNYSVFSGFFYVICRVSN